MSEKNARAYFVLTSALTYKACAFNLLAFAEMENLHADQDSNCSSVTANSASLLIPSGEKGVSYVSIHVEETAPTQPMAGVHGLTIKGMEMCKGLEFDNNNLEALNLLLQKSKTTLASFLSKFQVDDFFMVVTISSKTDGVPHLHTVQATLIHIEKASSTTHKADSLSSLAISIMANLMYEAHRYQSESLGAAAEVPRPRHVQQLSTIAEASFSEATSKVSSPVDIRKERYDAVKEYLERPNTSAMNVLQEYCQDKGYSLYDAVHFSDAVQNGPPHAPRFHQKIILKKDVLGLVDDIEVVGSWTTARSARQKACCLAVLELAKLGFEVLPPKKKGYKKY